MEGDVIITQDLFVYDIMGEDANGKLIGRHRSTGIGRPRFWERARYYGEEKRLAAALDAAEAADEPQIGEADRCRCRSLAMFVPGRASRSAASPGFSSIRSSRASGKPKSASKASRRRRAGAARRRARQPTAFAARAGRDTLKELEDRSKKQKKLPLGDPHRAGRADLVASGSSSSSPPVSALAFMFVGASARRRACWSSPALGFAGGFGLPRWI